MPLVEALLLGEAGDEDPPEEPRLHAQGHRHERPERHDRRRREEARPLAPLLEQRRVRAVVVDERLRREDAVLRADPRLALRVGQREGVALAGDGQLGHAGGRRRDRRLQAAARLDEPLALEVAPLAVVEPGRHEIALELVDGGIADGRENLFERQARRNRLAHRVERHRLAQAQVLRRQPLLLEAALHDADDLLDLERLEDVVVGAALHRVDGRLHRAEAGHDDGERVGRGGADRVEQLDAAHARHLEVADDEIVVGVAELRERRRAVLRRADDVPLHAEEVGQDVPDELLVVDDEDARSFVGGGDRHRRGHARRESRTLTDPPSWKCILRVVSSAAMGATPSCAGCSRVEA